MCWNPWSLWNSDCRESTPYVVLLDFSVNSILAIPPFLFLLLFLYNRCLFHSPFLLGPWIDDVYGGRRYMIVQDAKDFLYINSFSQQFSLRCSHTRWHGLRNYL